MKVYIEPRDFNGAKVAAEATQGSGGFLRCETCRTEEPLGDTTRHYRNGWPRCCGQTMRWWTQRQVDAGEVPRVTTEFVKCRVCDCGMRVEVSVVHVREHMEAGDLIRAASRQEIAELEKETTL